MKEPRIQKLSTRKPRQERARLKVELILEAAMRLLDKGGMALLTTNAVAEKAGVSVGTLYQYFPNKEAIIEALAEQERARLTARILDALRDSSGISPQQRVARIIGAVAGAYGERQRVHALVLEYSLSRNASLAAPMIEQILALLTSGATPIRPLPEADAFVLTYAFVGVMRAMIVRADAPRPTQAQIEEAMGRLIVTFVRGGSA